MTKEEIKALIDGKIAGQGTNIDGGGALATILNSIVDALPEGGGAKIFPIKIYTEYNDGELSRYRCDHTFSEITTALMDGYIVVANGMNDDGENTMVVSTLVTSYDDYEERIKFGFSAFNCDGDMDIEPL